MWSRYIVQSLQELYICNTNICRAKTDDEINKLENMLFYFFPKYIFKFSFITS